jgi:undecaprenyl-diphosphatase
MDKNIFLAINQLSRKNDIIDHIGIFLADYLLYVMVGFILVLALKKVWSLRPYVSLALASVVLSRLVIVEILKRVFARARPFEVFPDIRPLIIDEDALRSFPSGHTVIYFSIAFSFWGTKYFWPLFVLAVLGSLARIFVGVHYPSDILASVLIAFLVVWSLRGLFKKPNLS